MTDQTLAISGNDLWNQRSSARMSVLFFWPSVRRLYSFPPFNHVFKHSFMSLRSMVNPASLIIAERGSIVGWVKISVHRVRSTNRASRLIFFHSHSASRRAFALGWVLAGRFLYSSTEHW